MKVNYTKAYQYLQENGYRHHGRNITQRTIRTLVDNGTIKSCTCECSKSNVIEIDDLKSLVDEYVRKNALKSGLNMLDQIIKNPSEV
jgi:hypothetical protein